MSILYDRILKWRIENNVTVYAIEKGASLTIGSLKNWGVSMPSGDKILRVANYMDVSVDYLLGNTDNPKSHLNNEQDLSGAASDLLLIMKSLSETTSNATIEATEQIDELIKKYHISSSANASKDPLDGNN